MQSVRAVVADSGDSLPDLCRRLMAAGLDSELRLDVYRDGAPSFGVKSLHAGQFEHSFDGIFLTQENNIMPTRNGRDQSDPNSGIPRLKVAAAPMPRTALPQHETPGSVETGQDDDLPEVIERLLEFCVERDLPPNSPMDEVAEQFLAEHAGGKDAGPPRPNIDDEQPPDDEIDRVMEHIVRSPEAASRLLEKLRASDLPPGLRDKASRDQLERQIEHLDPRSASDALENIKAIELMREHGNLERGVGPRMAERRGMEPWFPGQGERVAGDMPPPFPGRPTPGGHPLPGRQERAGIDKRMAGDAALKSFAKLCGVKKKHLPRSI
jgi:hypothetical protein